MDKKTKFKEAFKIALAFALVYAIALKVNWLSPSWAGWSVVAIAATSGAESLAKGFLRIWGTILACAVGITIISLGAQNRYLFMLLTATWLFFSTYKMLADKKRSYFWFCAGYVTLVITAAGPSSAGGFYVAVFRTIETIMGIVVYTLIAVFLWPRTNIGAIKKTLSTVLDTQSKLLQEVYKVLSGTNLIEQLKELSQQQVKQLEKFSQSLIAEGSENYKVQELKPFWDQFESLSNSLMKSFYRLLGGIEDVSKIDILEHRPDIDNYFEEINNRFTEMLNLLSGNPASIKLQDVKVAFSSLPRTDISHFDKAALSIILSELNNIEMISREMLDVAISLAGSDLSGQKTLVRDVKYQKKTGFNFPVLDIEYLKGSLYVSLVIILGFIIWFYVNPPGHSTWYIMGGVFALIFSGAQQVKTVKLVFPFIISMFLVSFIYLFVLPELTNVVELGILLFSCMFVIQYFLSGPATAVFTIVVIQLIAVNNPQTYDASALINSFVFVSMLMIYLFGMSYLINSPRPEKAFLKLVSRFFKSAKNLISLHAIDTNPSSFMQRYKTAFYQYEQHSLPVKIRVWGKSIDKNLFPNTDYQQIEELVNTLEVLVVRMETLMAVKTGKQENNIELSEIIIAWRQRLIKAFDSWDNLSEEEIKGNTSELVLKRMDELERKLKDIVARDEDKVNEYDGIQFYHLMGGYRGVTEATLSFVRVADKLDWKQWKEEKFQ